MRIPSRAPVLIAAAMCFLPFIAASGTAIAPGNHPAPPENTIASNRTEPDMDRPLAWMIAAQNSDGSWGADVHSQSPDVATTSIAGIALLRLGHTGSRGEFQASTRRAVEYVMGAVERAPADQIAVQDAGTLPQRKLGRNIDTYVAAQFLSEALPTLRGPLQARAEKALASAVKRIERAQGKDGSYSRDGWAPLLASAFASNGLYAAQRDGA